MSTLFNCITKDDVIKALTSGIDINKSCLVHNERHTPLSFACKQGHFEIVQALLDNGANLDCGAIQMAASEGYVNIIDLLLKYNLSIINTRSAYGTALECAIKNGNIDVLDYLLSIDSININQISDYEYTPLMIACQYKNIDAVNRLLNAGADINIANKLGTNAIFVTCMYGTRSIFDQLVIHGANFYTNFTDNTPLMVACSSNNYEIVKGLIELGVDVNDQTPLLKAIKNENLKIIDLLIEAGVHINVIHDIKNDYNEPRARGSSGQSCSHDCYNQTPLSYACLNGNIEIVQKLLDYGADPINKNLHYGPIQFAAISGSLDIFQLLVNLGIDINDTSCISKEPPLYLAVKNGKRDIFDYLISHKDININKNGNFLETPLMAACRNNNIYMVQKLLNLNANVHAINFDGTNALYIACMNGYSDIFDMLINHGANFNGVSGYHTPLARASLNGHYKIVKRLIRLGVNINEQNIKNGDTALICAVCKSQYKVVDILLQFGADVSIIDNLKRTALDYSECDPNIINLFQNFGYILSKTFHK